MKDQEERQGPYIRSVEKLTDERERYSYGLPAIRNLIRLAFLGPVTFFVGENGTGKSPLLEALALMRQLAMLARMRQLVSDRSQFIIATHSPILMAYPGATIYQFSEEGIEETEYRKTEHDQITSEFLQNPERMLRILLEE